MARKRRALGSTEHDMEPPEAMIAAAETFAQRACAKAPAGRVGECLDVALFRWKAWSGKAFNRAVDRFERSRRKRG